MGTRYFAGRTDTNSLGSTVFAVADSETLRRLEARYEVVRISRRHAEQLWASGAHFAIPEYLNYVWPFSRDEALPSLVAGTLEHLDRLDAEEREAASFFDALEDECEASRGR